MEQGEREIIWESENRDLIISKGLDDFIAKLKDISKSKRESATLGFLREILEEKKILEEFHD